VLSGGRCAARRLKRAQILLAADDGASDQGHRQLNRKLGRRKAIFLEVKSGRSACLGDLAPNPEGALARSAAAVGSDGFGIGNVEEIRHLTVNG
jgi:hypothetical protein